MRRVFRTRGAYVRLSSDPILRRFIVTRRPEPHEYDKLILGGFLPPFMPFSENERFRPLWVTGLHLYKAKTHFVLTARHNILIREVLG